MSPSIDRYEQPHFCKSWSLWGTSTTPITFGGTTHQGISNPGGFWNALIIASFPSVRGANRERCCAETWFLQTRGAGGEWDIQGQPQVLRPWNGGSLGQQGECTASLLQTLGEQALACLGSYLEDYHGIPWRELGPKNSGWYSRITSSKIRSDASQQSTSQTKTPGGLHGWTRSSWTKEESLQRVKGRICNLGGIQINCLGRQRSR